MSSNISLQWLLRLPPSLRCVAFSTRVARPMDTRIFCQTSWPSRFLSTTRPHLAKNARPPKPSLKKTNNPSNANVSPTKAPPPPAPRNPVPKPEPATLQHSFNIKLDSRIEHVLRKTGKVMIYHAPPHTSFYVTSYLVGLAFIGGAVSFTSLIDSSRPVPWYIQSTVMIPALFFVILGTTFIMGPNKLIRSIYLVTDPGDPGRLLVRFHTRPSFPFINHMRSVNRVIESPKEEFFVDDKVLPFRQHRVPANRVEEFTEEFCNPAPARGIGERVRAFNRSLLDIWPILRHNVKRMFLREGFLYARIGNTHGLWKIDVAGAYVLDQAKPWYASITPIELDRSIFAKTVQRVAGLLR